MTDLDDFLAGVDEIAGARDRGELTQEQAEEACALLAGAGGGGPHQHARRGEADQYGWDDMGLHQGGPKHRYKGTPPDKGNRYQISPPGSRKKGAGAAPPAPKPAPAPRAARPTPEQAVAAIEAMRARGTATPEDHAALVEQLRGLTVPQLTELKKSLGLKASGPKPELARKLAERALAAGAKKAEAPAPEEKPPEEEAPAAAPAEKPGTPGADTAALLDAASDAEEDMRAALADPSGPAARAFAEAARAAGMSEYQTGDILKVPRSPVEVNSRSWMAGRMRQAIEDAAGPVAPYADESGAWSSFSATWLAADRRADGPVKIPDLIDAMREGHPGMSPRQARDLLSRWQREDRLTLQTVNDPYVEPRAGEGIHVGIGGDEPRTLLYAEAGGRQVEAMRGAAAGGGPHAELTAPAPKPAAAAAPGAKAAPDLKAIAREYNPTTAREKGMDPAMAARVGQVADMLAGGRGAEIDATLFSQLRDFAAQGHWAGSPEGQAAAEKVLAAAEAALSPKVRQELEARAARGGGRAGAAESPPEAAPADDDLRRKQYEWDRLQTADDSELLKDELAAKRGPRPGAAPKPAPAAKAPEPKAVHDAFRKLDPKGDNMVSLADLSKATGLPAAELKARAKEMGFVHLPSEGRHGEVKHEGYLQRKVN